jgi:hypothetical protein
VLDSKARYQSYRFANLILMTLPEVFLALGEPKFGLLLRTISMGKLRTYQMYERLRDRMRLHKLNTESLRKGAPRFWQRLSEGDEDLGTDLAQAVLISNIDAVIDVLNFLGVPHEDGFFAKDLDASQYLTEDWQQRVYGEFKEKHPEPLVLFYVNHLAFDLGKAEESFQPAA